MEKALSGRHFATYFDGGYATRAAALWGSMARHSPDATLWALCLDDGAAQAVKTLAPSNVRVVELSELEQLDPELVSTRPGRSTVEYYFTCGPSFLLQLLDGPATLGEVTYLDADLFFFANPEEAFEEVGDASIAIVEHRFAREHEHELVHGRFNVAWNTFRRDDEGLRCLRWWRERCIEWCFDQVEDERFADQKYLDSWPDRFNGVHVIQHLGVDAAPWNVGNQVVSAVGPDVFVGGDRLIAYHFQGLKRRNRWIIDTNLGVYGVRLDRTLRDLVYVPYISALRDAAHRLGRVDVETKRIRIETYRLPLPLARVRSLIADGLSKRLVWAPAPSPR